MGLNTKRRISSAPPRAAQWVCHGTLYNFHIFRVNILSFLALAKRFFCFACEVTRVLGDLRFRKGNRKASQTKNTIQLGAPSKDLKSTKKVKMHVHPYSFVFFVGAAVRRRSAGAKYISTREHLETTKKTMCANAKRGTISAEKKTNSYNVA